MAYLIIGGLDILIPFTYFTLVAQRVKCLLAMQETWVRSPGREDPLEKEMATHSGTFAWRIRWLEEPGVPVHPITQCCLHYEPPHLQAQNEVLPPLKH